MEMERINDNTIRVMIENSDLQERGISIMELLGNHDKIESFFYSILSEVDINHDFNEEDQVTFQILPNRNGLELFISRLDEEHQVGDIINNLMSYAKQQSEEIDQVSDERRSALRQTDDGQTVSSPSQQQATTIASDTQQQPVDHLLTVKLPYFEAIIPIAHLTNRLDRASDLYRYQSDFYLTLHYEQDNVSHDMMKDQKAMILEYATVTAVQNDVLREHGELVMQRDALKQIKNLF
ncbi:adaptor protein MecA [Leuconostoc lactis]|uniref:adaptor protein MecA n=1 Tax=Leuconostoc lactis TaxID=1246 RepID=UPI00020DA1C3|nr:adaptor protein MecA [Leuconostoc lactis]MCT3114739.1 adaptor protein MecA [Leuconostoc lactis]ORI85545.1 adaptor protein MecA [Leuconostoc lactis]ORI87754.1 adaptor protein MecA [Leuconostoc lactis]